jgi:hypothetical protein
MRELCGRNSERTNVAIAGAGIVRQFEPHKRNYVQALAASSDPSGKKYCVPLMGADTLRRSSCRS